MGRGGGIFSNFSVDFFLKYYFNKVCLAMQDDKVLGKDLPSEKRVSIPKFKVGERVGRYVKIKEVSAEHVFRTIYYNERI